MLPETCEVLKDQMAALACISKPYDDPACSHVEVAHEADLVVAPVKIVVIIANGMDPYMS